MPKFGAFCRKFSETGGGGGAADPPVPLGSYVILTGLAGRQEKKNNVNAKRRYPDFCLSKLIPDILAELAPSHRAFFLRTRVATSNCHSVSLCPVFFIIIKHFVCFVLGSWCLKLSEDQAFDLTLHWMT